MNLLNNLEIHAQKHPHKPAVIFKENVITSRQLRDFVFKLADSFSGLGIKRGDKVAVYLPNCPEYIFSYLAVWFCGATVVPLDFMLTENELASCLTHAEAKFLIARSKPSLHPEVLQQRCSGLQGVVLCHEKKEGCLSFEELLEKGENKSLRVKAEDKDCAIIFYTSGTTGKPKGVLINYLQLEAPPKAFKHFVSSDLTENDTTLCALPFSHLAGLIYIQANIVFDVTVVLMERFLPLEFLKQVQAYKVNWFWLVPSMYYALLQLKEFETFDLSGLRWLVVFGAPSSPDAMRRFHQHCPQAELYHGWGLTETNAPTVVIPKGSHNLESVGKPAPWIEVKVFGDDGKEVPAGGIGEIAVRGWVVTEGYYKDPELTAQTIRGGWFYTGDLGKIDTEGYLYIKGRKKEMIKVAGEIVFEPEVEAALHKHPAVAEAAVIGVADKLRGELPKAFVVLKAGEQLDAEGLRQFLRQHLAHFKIPHYFAFTDSLPKNRTGKIDKERLRNPS